MKIRTGFVSNSSSSSYVCDVCGESCSGMDMGLSDAQMYECTNGHTFCESHIDDSEIHAAIRRDSEAELREKHADFDTMDAEDREDMLQDWMDDMRSEFRYGLNASVCPCCTFQSSTTGEMLQFLLKEYGLTAKSVQEAMRERFKSFQEFKDFVR